MKLNMDNAPKFPSEELQIGNVYRCKGGRGSNHKYWVVAAITDKMVVLLGIDDEGNIISSANYGRYVFDNSDVNFTRGREILGRVKDMSALVFNVEWEAVL